MALAEVNELVRGARIALDENDVTGRLPLVGDADALGLDELIRSKVAEACQQVHMEAPAMLLEDGHNFMDEATYMDDLGRGWGWLELPKDFMRLICFKMSGWERAVTEPISDTDAAYALQRSKWPGIGGTPERPVCALCKRPSGMVLEFYKCRPGERADIVQASYQPLPKIENGRIDISPRLRRAVEYKIAALTAASVGEAERAQALNEMATNSMT